MCRAVNEKLLARVVVRMVLVCAGLVGPVGLVGPICLSAHAEGDLFAIRSYDGNFLVTAPDHSTCAWAGKIAEMTRQRVFALFGHEASWSAPATILLRAQTPDNVTGGPQLWTITVSRGGVEARHAEVYPNKRGDLLVLSVVTVCLGDMMRAPSPEPASDTERKVPPWLVCGVAENLSGATLVDLRGYAADIATKEGFLPFEKLFAAEAIPLEEADRELFFRQSGSIVDFLLHQDDGRARLREMVVGPTGNGDWTASLLKVFGGDFGTLSQVQESWKEFAIRQAERTIGGAKLLLSETRDALQDVLSVNIPTVDRNTLEEQVITTDLDGLFQHRNRRLVQQIASDKASAVFRLSLRSRPEYGPVLEEYLQALTAVARNDRSEFKRHFALAERLRKELEESAAFEEGTERGNSGDE